MEYISKHLSANSFFFESPIEVIISVMIDFETFIEPYYKQLMSITDKKEFEKEFYKYWDQYEENETNNLQFFKLKKIILFKYVLYLFLFSFFFSYEKQKNI